MNGKVYIREISSGIYQINYFTSTSAKVQFPKVFNCKEDDFINAQKVIDILNSGNIIVVIENNKGDVIY